MLKVLVGCEYSARVRDAFRKLGHDAWSCDLLPCEGDPRWHIQDDIFLAISSRMWDLIILHPPCTRLTGSGAWYVKRNAHAQVEQATAIGFVERIWETAKACSHAVVLENPVGVLSTKSTMGKPSQIVQPYEYGDDASKKTCLWMRGVEPLIPTKYVEPRITTTGAWRWANQTDSGQNKLSPSADRWKERSRTYQGIADAMAGQFSAQLTGAKYGA